MRTKFFETGIVGTCLAGLSAAVLVGKHADAGLFGSNFLWHVGPSGVAAPTQIGAALILVAGIAFFAGVAGFVSAKLSA